MKKRILIIGGAHVGITSSQILGMVMTTPVFAAAANFETDKDALLKVLENQLLVEKYFVAGFDLSIDNLKDNAIVYDLIDQLLIPEKREVAIGVLSDVIEHEKMMSFLLEKRQHRNLSAVLVREPVMRDFFANQKSKKQKKYYSHYTSMLISQNIIGKLNQKIPYKLRQPQSRTNYKFVRA